MPQYYYTAKSKEKKSEIADISQASSKKALAEKLKDKDLFLVEAEEIKEKNFFPFFNKVSLEDKIFFARNLRMMLSGGLSLSRSLKTIALQTENKRFRNVLLNIREEVHKGKSFSQALDMYPDMFSKIFRSVIKLSEETGKIEENLNILVNQFKKEHEIKSKVKSAMIYPSVILTAMVGVGIAMLVFVVPRMAETFESMEVELPITTRIFMAMGDFMASNWFLIPIILVAFILLLRMMAKTRKGKETIDTAVLKIPAVSQVIKKVNSARMARTLTSLLSSGVSIIKSLEILSESATNIHFKTAIEDSMQAVKKGDKLSEAFRPHSEILSVLMIQMIEVGEETGNTSEVLEETADFLEEDVFSAMDNLTSIIEPALMIVVGSAVAFFAFSMLIPIYSLLEGL